MYFNTHFTLSGDDADDIPGHLSTNTEVRFAMGLGRNRFSHVRIMARLYEPKPEYTDTEGVKVATYITPDGRVFSYLFQKGKQANRPKIGKLVYIQQLHTQELDEYEDWVRQQIGLRPLEGEDEPVDEPISLSELLRREPELEFDE